MLSEDLNDRVKLADDAYNLYKNIKLALEDEVCFYLLYYYLLHFVDNIVCFANPTALMSSKSATS